MQKPRNPQTQTNLPTIDSSKQYMTHNARDPRSYTYYKALKQLKEVNEQIVVFTNRIKLLNIKEQQTKNPVSQFYEKREERLKTINQEYRQKSQQDLMRMKNRTSTQVALRRVRNQMNKQEHLRRIDRAKRNISQERFHRHDVVREISQQNKTIIDRIRMKSLMEKQQRHRTMFEHQRKSRIYLKELQQSRIQEIKQQSQRQTNRILNKIKQKQRQLTQIKYECQHHQQKLIIAMSRKQKKMRKKQYSHKPLTVETTKSIIFDQDSISTPRSTVHYVVIS